MPQTLARTINELVAAKARATKTADPVVIREASQALNAARAERAIRENMSAHGITDDDRARLAALLLDGTD